MVADGNEVSLTEDEIGNLFQVTFAEDEVGNEWLKASLHAFLEEPSSWQEHTNIMDYQVCDQSTANFLVKNSGVNIIALYDTGTNMSCMSYACDI